MGGQVRIGRHGGLGWIIFDHPQRRNAISAEMWQAVPPAARTLDEAPDIRVVIMRAAGGARRVHGIRVGGVHVVAGEEAYGGLAVEI
jgi:enoyl-CoA hydratase/carnithine racemase